MAFIHAGLHMMEQYRGRNLGELSPHVYAIADAAYRQMRREKRSQSILVSRRAGGRAGCEQPWVEQPWRKQPWVEQPWGEQAGVCSRGI